MQFIQIPSAIPQIFSIYAIVSGWKMRYTRERITERGLCKPGAARFVFGFHPVSPGYDKKGGETREKDHPQEGVRH